MKSTILFTTLLLLFSSCKKNSTNNNTNPPQPGLQNFPVSWIFTVDEAPDKYIFIRTNGANMFRKSVLQSYSLTQLAIDEDCKFEVAQSRNEANNKDCFSIRLDKNKKLWCGVAPSPNQQEMHMHTLNGNSTDPGDGYKFFLHFMPKVNGVTTVAIESVWKPGYYISTAAPGFNYAQNQLVLIQHAKPEDATKWQCR